MKKRKDKEEIFLDCTDYCIYCGNPIPEGRMICYSCEKELRSLERKNKEFKMEIVFTED